MSSPRRLVFLCSGGGGNLRFVRRCAAAGLLPGWRLAGVVADRDCGALEEARAAGEEARRVAYVRGDSRALLDAVASLEPELVVSTFDRILDDAVVDALAGRIVNLHYALLPAFAGVTGATPVRQALESGCTILGATVHEVTRAVDAGPILAQGAVPVLRGEVFAATMDRVFRCGAVTLAGVLARRRDGAGSAEAGWAWRRDVEGLFAPPPAFPDGAFDEAFWRSLA